MLHFIEFFLFALKTFRVVCLRSLRSSRSLNSFTMHGNRMRFPFRIKGAFLRSDLVPLHCPSINRIRTCRHQTGSIDRNSIERSPNLLISTSLRRRINSKSTSKRKAKASVHSVRITRVLQSMQVSVENSLHDVRHLSVFSKSPLT